jgi:hypothetical protein
MSDSRVPLLDFADHPGAFKNGLISVAAQTSHMQQDVLHPVVRNDETEPLGDVKPLDDAGNLHEIHRVAAGLGVSLVFL